VKKIISVFALGVCGLLCFQSKVNAIPIQIQAVIVLPEETFSTNSCNHECRHRRKHRQRRYEQRENPNDYNYNKSTSVTNQSLCYQVDPYGNQSQINCPSVGNGVNRNTIFNSGNYRYNNINNTSVNNGLQPCSQTGYRVPCTSPNN
jgi:hypothetical protein